MAGLNVGGRVRLKSNPSEVGTLLEIGAKKARIEMDDGRGDRVVPVADIEPKRGATVGTVAPQYRDPGRVEVRRVIAARIRARCRELNMSLNQLAKLSGVSRSTLTRALNGHTGQLKIETAEALASAVGVSPSEFWECDARK